VTITLALLLLIKNLVSDVIIVTLHWFITKNLIGIIYLFEFLCCRFFVLGDFVWVVFLSKFVKSLFNLKLVTGIRVWNVQTFVKVIWLLVLNFLSLWGECTCLFIK
jgi:hypothetical protein